MKILITGATGLIGKNLIGMLYGHVYVISRSKKDLNELKRKFPHIRVIPGDISDEVLVKKALKGMDVIVHLAALRAVGIAEREVENCVNTNIIGTINLLKHFSGRKFITLSTDKAVKVKSVYGATKFITEKLVSEYEKINTDIDYYVLRSGNVFGSKDSVISIWKKLLKKGEEINVTDLNATRYFCSVNDVVDTIHKLIEYNYFGVKGPFCLNSIKSLNIRDLLEAMQLKYGRAKKVNIIGRQPSENLHEQLIEGGLSSSRARKYTVQEILEYI